MITFPFAGFLFIKQLNSKLIQLLEKDLKTKTYNAIDTWLAAILAASAVPTTIFARFLTRRARNGTIHTAAVNGNDWFI
jgi:hypothetical protein